MANGVNYIDIEAAERERRKREEQRRQNEQRRAEQQRAQRQAKNAQEKARRASIDKEREKKADQTRSKVIKGAADLVNRLNDYQTQTQKQQKQISDNINKSDNVQAEINLPFYHKTVEVPKSEDGYSFSANTGSISNSEVNEQRRRWREGEAGHVASFIENTKEALESGGKGRAADLVKGVGYGARAAGNVLYGEDSKSAQALKDFSDAINENPFITGLEQQAQIDAQNAYATSDNKVANIWNDLVQNAGGNAITSIAGAPFGRYGTLATMGTSSFGHGVDEILNDPEHQYSFNQAARYGLAEAANETLQEAFSPRLPFEMPTSLSDVAGEFAQEAFGEFLQPYERLALLENPDDISNALVDIATGRYRDENGNFTMSSVGSGLAERGTDILKAGAMGAAGSLLQGAVANPVQTVQNIRNAPAEVRDIATASSNKRHNTSAYDQDAKTVEAKKNLKVAEDATAVGKVSEESKAAVNQARDEVIRNARKHLYDENGNIRLNSTNRVEKQAAERANADIIRESAKKYNVDSKSVENMVKLANKIGVGFQFDSKTTTLQYRDANGNMVTEKLDGFYRDGALRVNPESDNAVETTFAHEFTHALENSEGYKEFKDALYKLVDKGYLKSKYGDGSVDYLKHLIARGYETADAATIESESVAFLTQELLGNESAINYLVSENRNAAQRMYDWLKDTWNKIGASEEERFEIDKHRAIQKTMDLYKNALKNPNVQYNSSMQKKIDLDNFETDKVIDLTEDDITDDENEFDGFDIMDLLEEDDEQAGNRSRSVELDENAVAKDTGAQWSNEKRADGSRKDLVAVKNIDSADFLKSLEDGGMPATSIGIIKDTLKRALTYFGDVTVVYDPSVVSPDDITEVTTHDNWSFVYPKTIEYSKFQRYLAPITKKKMAEIAEKQTGQKIRRSRNGTPIIKEMPKLFNANEYERYTYTPIFETDALTDPETGEIIAEDLYTELGSNNEELKGWFFATPENIAACANQQRKSNYYVQARQSENTLFTNFLFVKGILATQNPLRTKEEIVEQGSHLYDNADDEKNKDLSAYSEYTSAYGQIEDYIEYAQNMAEELDEEDFAYIDMNSKDFTDFMMNCLYDQNLTADKVEEYFEQLGSIRLPHDLASYFANAINDLRALKSSEYMELKPYKVLETNQQNIRAVVVSKDDLAAQTFENKMYGDEGNLVKISNKLDELGIPLMAVEDERELQDVIGMMNDAKMSRRAALDNVELDENAVTKDTGMQWSNERRADGSRKDLVAVRCLNKESYLAAIYTGGMVTPSIGVIRDAMDLTTGTFGPVTVIMDPSTVIPSKTVAVASRDNYTPEYPMTDDVEEFSDNFFKNEYWGDETVIKQFTKEMIDEFYRKTGKKVGKEDIKFFRAKTADGVLKELRDPKTGEVIEKYDIKKRFPMYLDDGVMESGWFLATPDNVSAYNFALKPKMYEWQMSPASAKTFDFMMGIRANDLPNIEAMIESSKNLSSVGLKDYDKARKNWLDFYKSGLKRSAERAKIDEWDLDDFLLKVFKDKNLSASSIMKYADSTLSSKYSTPAIKKFMTLSLANQLLNQINYMDSIKMSFYEEAKNYTKVEVNKSNIRRTIFVGKESEILDEYGELIDLLEDLGIPVSIAIDERERQDIIGMEKDAKLSKDVYGADTSDNAKQLADILQQENPSSFTITDGQKTATVTVKMVPKRTWNAETKRLEENKKEKVPSYVVEGTDRTGSPFKSEYPQSKFVDGLWSQFDHNARITIGDKNFDFGNYGKTETKAAQTEDSAKTPKRVSQSKQISDQIINILTKEIGISYRDAAGIRSSIIRRSGWRLTNKAVDQIIESVESTGKTYDKEKFFDAIERIKKLIAEGDEQFKANKKKEAENKLYAEMISHQPTPEKIDEKTVKNILSEKLGIDEKDFVKIKASLSRKGTWTVKDTTVSVVKGVATKEYSDNDLFDAMMAVRGYADNRKEQFENKKNSKPKQSETIKPSQQEVYDSTFAPQTPQPTGKVKVTPSQKQAMVEFMNNLIGSEQDQAKAKQIVRNAVINLEEQKAFNGADIDKNALSIGDSYRKTQKGNYLLGQTDNHYIIANYNVQKMQFDNFRMIEKNSVFKPTTTIPNTPKEGTIKERRSKNWEEKYEKYRNIPYEKPVNKLSEKLAKELYLSNKSANEIVEYWKNSGKQVSDKFNKYYEENQANGGLEYSEFQDLLNAEHRAYKLGGRTESTVKKPKTEQNVYEEVVTQPKTETITPKQETKTEQEMFNETVNNKKDTASEVEKWRKGYRKGNVPKATDSPNYKENIDPSVLSSVNRVSSAQKVKAWRNDYKTKIIPNAKDSKTYSDKIAPSIMESVERVQKSISDTVKTIAPNLENDETFNKVMDDEIRKVSKFNEHVAKGETAGNSEFISTDSQVAYKQKVKNKADDVTYTPISYNNHYNAATAKLEKHGQEAVYKDFLRRSKNVLNDDFVENGQESFRKQFGDIVHDAKNQLDFKNHMSQYIADGLAVRDSIEREKADFVTENITSKGYKIREYYNAEGNTVARITKDNKIVPEAEELAKKIDEYNNKIQEINKGLSSVSSIAGTVLGEFRINAKLTPSNQWAELVKGVRLINKNLHNDFRRQFADGRMQDLSIDEYKDRFLQAKTDEERDEIKLEIARMLADKVPYSIKEKSNAYRYTQMLGNPLTLLRNSLGNVSNQGFLAMSDMTRAGIERLAQSENEALNKLGIGGHVKFDKLDLSRNAKGQFNNVNDVALLDWSRRNVEDMFAQDYESFMKSGGAKSKKAFFKELGYSSSALNKMVKYKGGTFSLNGNEYFESRIANTFANQLKAKGVTFDEEGNIQGITEKELKQTLRDSYNIAHRQFIDSEDLRAFTAKGRTKVNKNVLSGMKGYLENRISDRGFMTSKEATVRSSNKNSLAKQVYEIRSETKDVFDTNHKGGRFNPLNIQNAWMNKKNRFVSKAMNEGLGNGIGRYLGDKQFTVDRSAKMLTRALTAQGYDISFEGDNIILMKDGETLSAEKSDLIINKYAQEAVKQGMESVYRDYNELAEALNNLQNVNDITNFVMMAELPFKRTPMNIVRRAVEYSPAGLAKAIGSIEKVRNGEMSGEQYLERLARGTTGTGAALIGAMLAGLGILKGGAGDDDEKEEKFLSSFNDPESLPYVLTDPKGGWSYTLSFLAPAVTPFLIGAQVYEALRDTHWEHDESWYKNSANYGYNLSMAVLSGIIDPIVNTTMLEGLFDTLDNLSGATGNPLNKTVTLLQSIMKNTVNQYGSTLSQNINNIVDDTVRSSYDDSYLGGVARSFAKKVPFASFFLEPTVDREGNEVKQEGETMFGRAVLNTVSPGKYKTNKMDAYTNELKRLYESDEVPDSAKTYLLPYLNYSRNGESMKAKEVTTWNKEVLSNSKNEIEDMMQSPLYKSLSDTEKAQLINKIRGYYVAKSDEKYYANKGESKPLSGSYSVVDKLEKKGINPYMTFHLKSIEATYPETKNAKAIEVREQLEAIGQYDTVRQMIDNGSIKPSDIGLNKTVYGWDEETFNSKLSDYNDGLAETNGSSDSTKEYTSSKKTSSSSVRSTIRSTARSSKSTSAKADELIDYMQTVLRNNASTLKKIKATVSSEIKSLYKSDQDLYDEILGRSKKLRKELGLKERN